MKIRRFPVYAVAVMLLTVVMVTRAQELCKELADDAMDEMEANCIDADGQTACYGFDSLTATFNEAIDSDTFSDPSDLIDLFELHTVHTQAFDEEEKEWGISYFRIPIEGSDQPLVILMAGDVIVENAVDPEADEGLSPMQAFNFETGGRAGCRDAPNAVFIQAPQNLEVDLRVNSTPIRIGSTIVLGTDEDENGEPLMYFGVLEGHLTTNPGTPEEQTVPEGNVTTVEIAPVDTDAAGELVPVLDPVTGEPIIGPNGEPFYRRVPVSDFTEPELITVDGEGFLSWSDYTFVSAIPEELIPYAISVGDECILTPREDLAELWAHVGAGRNRSVRTILDLDATYSPTSATTLDNGEVWYAIQTDLGELWVSAGDFQSDCASQVGVQVQRAPECALVAQEGLTSLNAHIGPGYNRTIRANLDLDATYTPLAQEEVDGVIWYQVATDFGDLWISGDDLANSCEVSAAEEPEAMFTEEPSVTEEPSGLTFTPTPTVFGTLTPTYTSSPGPSPTATNTLPPPTATLVPTDTSVPPTPIPPTDTPIPAPTNTPAPVSFTGTVIGCAAGSGSHDVTFSFNTIPANLNEISFSGSSGGWVLPYTGNPMTATIPDSYLPITWVTAYDASYGFLGDGPVSGSCP
jgi:hypothetical protein